MAGLLEYMFAAHAAFALRCRRSSRASQFLEVAAFKRVHGCVMLPISRFCVQQEVQVMACCSGNIEGHESKLRVTEQALLRGIPPCISRSGEKLLLRISPGQRNYVSFVLS
jgi:hypothetical protein